MSGAQKLSRSARFNLIAIGTVAALPLVGSYLLYLLWQPERFVNYGQLIEPTPLPELVAAPGMQAVKGKWVFVMVDAGSCDETCQRKLYVMRQLRLTQGKNMDRIERVWLIDDADRPAPPLMAEYEGTHALPAAGAQWLSKFPSTASSRDHIYIVDPLGNLMMRYPRDADPNRMKKDLSRLLRASRIG